jgi:membrane-associated phospholipid phosphatase
MPIGCSTSRTGWASRSRARSSTRSKALALAWGPLVSVAVVATANHYVFDIAAGLAVAVAGYWVGRAIAALQPPLGARRVTEPSYAG